MSLRWTTFDNNAQTKDYLIKAAKYVIRARLQQHASTFSSGSCSANTTTGTNDTNSHNELITTETISTPSEGPRESPLLKGNSTVKTNRAQINVHTFNKLFPKNLGPNHFSKGEIVRQSSQIIQISTPFCSFPCRRKSGQRPECDVIACFETGVVLAMLMFLYYSPS